MWIGNALLVILNLPMIGLWVKLLRVPYRLLFPAIMAFSAIGIYSVNNSSFEIYLTALFGVIGFIWIKLGCSPAPMLLGFVLGPMMEEHLRRAMLMSKGDPSVFVTRPISLAFIDRDRLHPGGDDRAGRPEEARRNRRIGGRRRCASAALADRRTRPDCRCTRSDPAHRRPRLPTAYAQFSRARIAFPITQSLSSSDRNGSSSVKWVMRWRYVALASELVRSVPQ